MLKDLTLPELRVSKLLAPHGLLKEVLVVEAVVAAVEVVEAAVEVVAEAAVLAVEDDAF